MTERTTERLGNGPGHGGSAMPPATTPRLEQDERVRRDDDERPDGEKSAAELEREVERERAELSATIGEIRRSLSPGQLLDQALEYAKGSGGGEFVANLSRSVRENPLPVVLVGAGIAWLMTSNGQRSSPIAEGTLGTAAGMRDQAASAGSTISDVAGRASSAAAGMAASVRDGISRSWKSGSETVGSATDAAMRAGNAARDGLRDFEHGAATHAHDARDRMMHSAGRVRHNLVRLVDEHPLVLGALGLAVGAAIAAALPRTRTEDALMGEASDSLKDEVRGIAHRQFEHAKDVATDAYEEISEDLGERGLSADTAAEAAQATADKVRKAGSRLAEGAKEDLKGEGTADSQDDLKSAKERTSGPAHRAGEAQAETEDDKPDSVSTGTPGSSPASSGTRD